MIDQQVILKNDRDRRTFEWLRKTVGDGAIAGAIERLAGERQPYLSNLCKVLDLTPPPDLDVTDKETALRNLAAIRAKMKFR
jgi:hypothetical protein